MRSTWPLSTSLLATKTTRTTRTTRTRRDEDEEDLEEEAEEDDEEDAAEEVDDDIPRVKPNANGDTLAASIARSGLVPVEESDSDSAEEEEEEEEESEDEEEAIAYEDLPDDIELSEAAKASRVQRIKVNNEAALRRITSDISLDTATSKLPWIETMRIVYPSTISSSSSVTDVENDLERELAFYKQALHAAVEGGKAAGAHSKQEATQRTHRRSQAQTTAMSTMMRTSLMLGWKKLLATNPSRCSRGRVGRQVVKAKMPRTARDAKYGFGGKKKYSKSNTAESTNDFSSGPTRGARGSKPKISGKAGFRPKQKSGAAKRPGKARRAGH
ncbi:hypothetical protein L1887_53651 [Cichorium endivia]|nr:hypothetical protein L1887_53651 [Cichorium endivia]